MSDKQLNILGLVSMGISLLGWLPMAIPFSPLAGKEYMFAFGWFFGWVGVSTIVLIVKNERRK